MPVQAPSRLVHCGLLARRPGTPNWRRATVKVITYTCAFPAKTSQTPPGLAFSIYYYLFVNTIVKKNIYTIPENLLLDYRTLPLDFHGALAQPWKKRRKKINQLEDIALLSLLSLFDIP